MKSSIEINNKNEVHLDWVDGLKGISAIIVVINHTICTLAGASMLYQPNQPPIIHNLYDGNFAVSIFIILSSILVCHGMEKHRDNILKRYHYLVLKRYFRILIPVGFIVIVMYLSNLLGLFYAEEYGIKTGNDWLMGQYIELKDLFGCVFAAPLGKCYKVLNVGWMLGYIFIATFWVILMDILTNGKSAKVRLMLLAICYYIALRTDFYYINVVAGFALYSFRNCITQNTWKWLLLICALAGFIVSDFIKYTEMWNMLRAILLVTMVFCVGSLQEFFSYSLFKWLGKISMNIYLLQLFVLYAFTCRLADIMPTSLSSNIILYMSTLLFVVLIAWLFSTFVEPVLNKVTDSITHRLQ